jgi:hypothetical protein
MRKTLTEAELMRSKPWDVPGKFCVSQITWLPEVQKELAAMPEKVNVADVTLREAEDNIAISFTIDQKVEISRRLADGRKGPLTAVTRAILTMKRQ